VLVTRAAFTKVCIESVALEEFSGVEEEIEEIEGD